MEAEVPQGLRGRYEAKLLRWPLMRLVLSWFELVKAMLSVLALTMIDEFIC